MKRHALFFATAIAVATLGAAGLAVAQSAPAAKADASAGAAHADAGGDRAKRHGRGHFGHRGHAMHGGIERMDTDGDGRVSRAEFDAAKAARDEAREARIAKRAEAGAAKPQRADRGGRHERAGMPAGPRMGFDFDAIDANKDGYIVRSEAAAHQERMRTQMREAGEKRFAEAFAAADLNKDGRLSRVEVDEKMPRLSKRFAWMDDNRDGFLSRAELEAGKRR